ncbi:MAG: LytTR family DNA-binding domain-containing protein [Mediterraneibacter faecis]
MFETSENNHKIILHAKKRVVEFTGHLKSVEVQLDYRFYRCHRSYIVNTDNIKEVNFQKLTSYMENGEICQSLSVPKLA